MASYKVNIAPKGIMIEGLSGSFRMRIFKDIRLNAIAEGPVIEATLYKEQESFVPSSYFIFEALDAHDQPAAEVNKEEFDRAIDHFFTSILGTEYYLKSVPARSTLCARELREFKFDQ